MNQQELDELVAAHEAWFKDNSVGRRLELSGVSLQGVTRDGSDVRERWALAELEQQDMLQRK